VPPLTTGPVFPKCTSEFECLFLSNLSASLTVSVTPTCECALDLSKLFCPHAALYRSPHDRHAGQTHRSAAWFTGGYTAAVLLGVAIAGGLAPIKPSLLRSGSNVGIALVVGVAIFTTCTAIAVAMREDKAMTVRQWFDIATCAGTRNLRSTFKLRPSAFERNLHIASFDIFLKYACFPALLGLIANQAVVDSNQYEDGYKDYPDWVQGVAGGGILGAMLIILAVFTLFPGLWDQLSGVKEVVSEEQQLEMALQKMVRPRNVC
jgi:cytochrome bd-type quinol oxidase subunit 2